MTDHTLFTMQQSVELLKYKLVFSCETLDELADAILEIATDGVIHGRTNSFSAETMALLCRAYVSYVEQDAANVLTRAYGIRQQALYILHSKGIIA